MSSSWKGGIALMSAAFLYGIFGLFTRELSSLLSDAGQVAARFLIAFGVIGVTLLLRRRIPGIARDKATNVIALGVVFTAVALLFTISINSTTIANSVFLMYAGSIVSSFAVGTFWLKEQVTPEKTLAMIVALTGLAMYTPDFLTVGAGILAGATAGLLDGVCNGLRKTLTDIDRTDVLFFQFGCTGAAGGVMALAMPGNVIREIDLISILLLITFGTSLVGLGHLLIYGFQRFDVNAGAIILATEICFATLLGFLAYGEVPKPNEFVGGALVFVASVLTVNDLPLPPRVRKALTGRRPQPRCDAEATRAPGATPH